MGTRRVDGAMGLAAREKALAEFEADPTVTVLLLSLKAAGLGLNLACANHVLLLDAWWNPSTEEQAVDRAHRLGQTRPVKVLRFAISGTVEDSILRLQEAKQHMTHAALTINGGTALTDCGIGNAAE